MQLATEGFPTIICIPHEWVVQPLLMKNCVSWKGGQKLKRKIGMFLLSIPFVFFTIFSSQTISVFAEELTPLEGQNEAIENEQLLIEEELPNDESTQTIHKEEPATVTPVIEQQKEQSVPVETEGSKPIIETDTEQDIDTNASTIQTPKEVKAVQSFTTQTKYFTVKDTMIPVYNNGKNGENILVGYVLPGKEYKIQRFSDGVNWIVVSFGDKNAYVRSSQVIPSTGSQFKNAVQTNQQQGGFLTNSKVAVYEQPSNRSAIYAYLQSNVKYSVVGEYYNFYLINVGGRIGYIHQDNLKQTLSFTTKTKYFKTNKSIAIYYQSSNGDKRVGTLLPNKEYKIQRFSDGVNWIVINFGHQNAYIRASDVIPSNGSNFKRPVTSNQTAGKATINSKAAAYVIPDNKLENIYAYLETGVTYEVLGSYYNYYLVNISGHYGYVHKDNTSSVAKYNVADRLTTIGQNGQLILVTSKGYSTNKARIQTFEKQNGKWNPVHDFNGFIGRDGFAPAMSEYVVQSPRGKYSIGTAFGRYKNPGTKLPYRTISSDDVWVDDPNSSYYNTWQKASQNNGKWKSAEKMNIPAYNYGFVINYNTERAKGKGSAIFFHVSDTYTYGCTGTSQQNVLNVLKWIDPKKNPVIIQTPESELGQY